MQPRAELEDYGSVSQDEVLDAGLRVGSLLPPPMPTVSEADSLEDTGPLSRYTPPSGRYPIRRREARPATIPPPSSRTRPLPSVPPTAPDDQQLKDLLDAPKSERAPVSTWRPKQNYPSYVPPPPESTREPERRAFAIKVLDSPAELASAYRLRYQVYETINYLQHPNRSQFEIDEYDSCSVPFGAISIHTGELVGTLRLIINHEEPFFIRHIRRILQVTKDPVLRSLVARPRERRMPSIISDLVQMMLDAYNTDHQLVEELSRTIVHPGFRGSGVSRGLMEFGLAYAMAATDPVLIGGCVPDHLPMYAKYGYEKLPGTDLDRYDTVGQVANTVVCNTRKLPEPTRSRVAMILRAMMLGEPECILEESAESTGEKGRGVWHFAERLVLSGLDMDPATLSGPRYASAERR